MAQADLAIRYDGDALAAGQMDVKQLAPALLALGDLFQEAGRELHPDDGPLTVNVRAVSAGSFTVQLIVEHAPTIGRKLVSILTGDEATAAANLAQITAASAGVFALLKGAHGRVARRQEHDDHQGRTTILFEDGTSITVPSDTIRLARNAAVRRHAREVVAPLERDGVDTFRLDTAAGSVDLSSSDVPAFDVPELAEELLVDQEQTVYLTVLTPTFIEGNKWRFAMGDVTFFASITDLEFVGKVQNGQESFSKHDVLRVDLHVRQWLAESGLRNEYTVVKVHEHVPGPRAVPLPFDT